MRTHRITKTVKLCIHFKYAIATKNLISHVGGFLNLPLVIEKIDSSLGFVLPDC